MIALVKEIRENEKPDAVVLLSHNGMDVDIKMAERVPGLNAVFGGHTHDGIPKPLEVKNVEGHTCLVTNAGSNGKYVGVMDFEFKDGKLKQLHYKMLPVITDWLPEDKEMSAYINQMRQTKYRQDYRKPHPRPVLQQEPSRQDLRGNPRRKTRDCRPAAVSTR